MLSVTESARAELLRIAAARALEPGRLLRLAVPPVWTGEGDWGIVVDRRGASDVAFAHQGSTALVVEREVADALANAALDYKTDGVPSPRFTLDIY